MISIRAASLSLMLVAAALAGRASAAEPAAATSHDWLMMVATRCTDAAREVEFNAWYDDIDIPDVLEVPGYVRARRGRRIGTAQDPVSALPQDEGRYVALYDIASDAIDKTIIEMLMATRKMEMRGRSTDLLKVTERVYYRRHGSTIQTDNLPAKDAKEFIYIERMDCCHDDAMAQRFNTWYDGRHLPEVLKTASVLRATRYELYRVLMVEPKQASRYLTVYELQAASTEEAARTMADLRQRLYAKAAEGLFEEGGSAMYQEIKDVRKE